jgi:hypothetical protein
MSSLVRKSTERGGAGKICQERCGKGPLYCPICKNDIKNVYAIVWNSVS